MFALALGPCAAVMVYIYLRDKHELEPVWLVAFTFLLGCLTVVPPIFLQGFAYRYDIGTGPGFLQVILHAFLIVAITEEGAKFLLLRVFSYPRKDFNEPFDGIVYSVMISMGFAAVENVWFVLAEPDFHKAASVGLLRIFTAVPAHATFGIIMGYYMGMAKFCAQDKAIVMLKGFLLAVLFHGLYDFFLMQNIHFGVGIGALISLIVAVWLSRKSIRIHCDNSPFREAVPPPQG